MVATYSEMLNRMVAELAPRRLLCVGRPAADHLAEYARTHGETVTFESRPASLLTPDGQPGHADLAYVAGTLEQLERPMAEQVLSRLRDVLASRVLLHLDLRTLLHHDWRRNDLIALGFSEIRVPETGGGRDQLFQFNLFDYKVTPDWFNAGNWAHPHRWKP